jgi:hypothetical protein
MVDIATVTALLIYRQVHETDVLNLLDLKHAAAVPVSNSTPAESS